jgi:hypothetical protein
MLYLAFLSFEHVASGETALRVEVLRYVTSDINTVTATVSKAVSCYREPEIASAAPRNDSWDVIVQ